jgi:F0F1-type ATP synthase membrane subunit c/vacuolar-type H+-ATPase subunit K
MRSNQPRNGCMNSNKTASSPPIKLILWGALFATNFLYLGILFGLPNENAIEQDPSLSYIMLTMGLVVLGLSFVLPNIISKIQAKNTIPNIQKEIAPFIVGLALNEASSIFGFIIAYIFGNHQLGLTLFGLSIASFLLKFPRKNIEDSTRPAKSSLDVD